jgi:phospholipase/lecithinase/hemolysin
MARARSWNVIVMVMVVLLGHSEVLQVRAVAQVAQFIFGDSLVDQGNNNNLNSIAKANFKPNGVDLAEFDYLPTGRFSNGRLVSDFISAYMGTEPVATYAEATEQDLLRGANFASAGSGILDDTGNIFLAKIPINQQIANFQSAKSQLESQIGQAATDQLLAKAIFAFTTGGNDFINNYLLPISPRAAQYNIDQYTKLLINNFEGQLTQVYNLGARKISIANIGPIGCIPDKLQSNSLDGSCVDQFNQVALGFNSMLKPMLDSLTTQLPGVIITYSDSYSMVWDIIQNPSNYGFESINTACCGSGRFNGLIPCNVLTSLCPDRTKYLFWDPFHPSERANSIAVEKLLFGPLENISPMNLSQLIPL